MLIVRSAALVSLQTPERNAHTPSGPGFGLWMQQAFSFAISVTSNAVGISVRTLKIFSSTITEFTPAQFCVTLKIMSGVQSHQGAQSNQGQMRSFSMSGVAFGNTPTILLRRP